MNSRFANSILQNSLAHKFTCSRELHEPRAR